MAGIACLAHGSGFLGRGLHRATIACAIGAGLVASAMLLRENGDARPLFAVLVILTLLGEVPTPILERSAAHEVRHAVRGLGSLDVPVPGRASASSASATARRRSRRTSPSSFEERKAAV
jgi:hypothetical protein